MSELAWILDPASGKLVVEGLTVEEASALAGDLLPPAREVNCAVPLEVLPPVLAAPSECGRGQAIQVLGYWHGSLIEGPGRRSVAKLAGCPIRCQGCLTPDSWDPAAGVPVPVGHMADLLLDPAHERDGVTIVGGEPFAQAEGLQALVAALRHGRCAHILVYSGYTYEDLRRRAAARPAIGAVLDEVDVLVDGPYIEKLAKGCGPWTGSLNQRVIDLAATRRHGRVELLAHDLE